MDTCVLPEEWNLMKISRYLLVVKPVNPVVKAGRKRLVCIRWNEGFYEYSHKI